MQEFVNVSIGELDLRVETLEDIVANHETRLTVGESQLEGMFSHRHKTLDSIEIKIIVHKTIFLSCMHRSADSY